MNENQFEQFIAQMLSGLQQSTDWMVTTQQRELVAHDQKLAAAEAVLVKALDFLKAERIRLRGGRQPEHGLRQLHEELNKPHPVPQEKPRELPRNQAKGQPF